MTESVILSAVSKFLAELVMSKFPYLNKKHVDVNSRLKKIASFVAKSVAVVAVGTATVGFIHGAYDAAVGNENKTAFEVSKTYKSWRPFKAVKEVIDDTHAEQKTNRIDHSRQVNRC